MNNWRLAPKNTRLAKYIEFFWLLEKKAGDASVAHPKLNCEPTSHFILANDDYLFSYSHQEEVTTGNGCHWILPHCKTYLMDHTEPFLIFGIKFRTGALYSLKSNVDLSGLDKIIRMNIQDCLETMLYEEVFNKEKYVAPFSLKKLLQIAKSSPVESCDYLEHYLLSWVDHAVEDKHSALTRQALSLLATNTLADVRDVLHCSQRTTERSFLRVTGFTLKQYQSVLKLESLVEYLYSLEESEIDWSEIAIQFNFSDQPHLIRYLKSYIGATPGNYVKKRDLTIDVYGTFE